MSGTSPDTPTPDGHGPSLTAVLERTTPPSVTPLDLDDLARRGRRRQRRRRTALAGTAVGLVALLAGVAVTATGTNRPADVGTASATPDGVTLTLTEPVGSWSQATDAPFGPRVGAFGGTLGDGRVLVWGGDTGGSGQRALDGGIYDPETGEWTPIPEAPLPATPNGASISPSPRLAGDRLAVVSESADGGGIRAAVYDVAEQRWHAAPEQAAIQVAYDAVAWDGETLALVRLERGQVGFLDDPNLDWRVDQPITLRWTVGQPEWQTGAPAPLGLRFGSDAAFDGTRLAMWGGTTTGAGPGAPPGPDPGAQADGAIYDLATDTWEPIAAGPLAGRIHPGVTWSEGRLLIGGGMDRLLDPGEDFRDLAAYDPASGAWETLEGPPEGGVSGSRDDVVGEAPIVTAGSPESSESLAFLGPDGWEQAPLGDLRRLGDVIVGTTATVGNPGDRSFGLRVRAERDTWLDSAEAPFGNRMEPTIVATGDRLVVFGGAEGRGLEPRSDVWVFDLTAD
jgi:hypothetical protein